MHPRKLAVMLGSKSDLAQCGAGLQLLIEMRDKGMVAFDGAHVVDVASIHRNTAHVLRVLEELSQAKTDAVIVGAGWANHLTGTADAYLRYALGDTHLVVYGVAFDDPNDPAHTDAAISGIMYVPGTQVQFDDYIGSAGFLRACRYAATETLPTIKPPTPRPPERLALEEALAYAKAAK